jgi:hypothetical protein
VAQQTADVLRRDTSVGFELASADQVAHTSSVTLGT